MNRRVIVVYVPFWPLGLIRVVDGLVSAEIVLGRDTCKSGKQSILRGSVRQ
jgi:hypothetical protein